MVPYSYYSGLTEKCLVWLRSGLRACAGMPRTDLAYDGCGRQRGRAGISRVQSRIGDSAVGCGIWRTRRVLCNAYGMRGTGVVYAAMGNVSMEGFLPTEVLWGGGVTELHGQWVLSNETYGYHPT
eukprot:1183518-Rhodomonas_salina.7